MIECVSTGSIVYFATSYYFHCMISSPNDLLHQLLEQRARVEAESNGMAANISVLQEKRASALLRLVDLDNRIQHLRICTGLVPLPGRTTVSKRNLGFLAAYAALHDAIKNIAGGGLSHHLVVDVIKRGAPGIPDATVRSHLYRLKKRGLIQKQGSHWYIVSEANRSRGDQSA